MFHVKHENGVNMKLCDLFNEFMENENFNEKLIETKNKQLFDKIDDELIKKWGEYLPIFINDIVYCDFDFENIREIINNGINDNIDNIVNDLIEIAEKYKNETIKL